MSTFLLRLVHYLVQTPWCDLISSYTTSRVWIYLSVILLPKWVLTLLSSLLILSEGEIILSATRRLCSTEYFHMGNSPSIPVLYSHLHSISYWGSCQNMQVMDPVNMWVCSSSLCRQFFSLPWNNCSVNAHLDYQLDSIKNCSL